MMRHKGFLVNITVLLLLIPLLLLVATYENASSAIIQAQSSRALVERQSFNVGTIQNDLQNAADLSFRRAYLALTEYVIYNGFVNNASSSIKELMINGSINGHPQPTMENFTLMVWFDNVKEYLSSQGMTINPANPDEFSKHIQITVAPLDSFHVAMRMKITNVTIVDASGRVKYEGDIPQRGYVYSVVSIVGFEDPYIVRELNGLYTRIIEPCKIAFPGPVYGYYNPDDQSDIDNLVLDWCYVGIPDNSSEGIVYPSILERFEGSTINHDYYLALSREFQKALGIQDTFPIGLATFLVPSNDVDPTLFGALRALNAQLPSAYENYTTVAYYYLQCVMNNKCNPNLIGSQVSPEYPAFKLDYATQEALFNQTVGG